jgi:ribosomal subunit interface protein
MIGADGGHRRQRHDEITQRAEPNHENTPNLWRRVPGRLCGLTGYRSLAIFRGPRSIVRYRLHSSQTKRIVGKKSDMNLTVKGKHLDVGDALRSHVEEQLTAVTEKYFSNPIDATVLFAHEAHLYRTDISVRIGRGIMLQSSAEATDIYPSFEAASEKVGKRLRRYKRRLRDHHMNGAITAAAEAEQVPARQYVIEAEVTATGDEEDFSAEPVIVAEMATTIETMSVAEAVMRMDLAELPALMFRSGSHGGLNMIYRRPDGNVGWVDPKALSRT